MVLSCIEVNDLRKACFLHVAPATDGCNVIGRHILLAQKSDAKIVSLESVHCHAHRLASVSYYRRLVQWVWGTKLRKHFNAIMEMFCCFTVTIDLPGGASDNEDKRSEVAALMQNKVFVEQGNSESWNRDCDFWAALKQLTGNDNDAMSVVLLQPIKKIQHGAFLFVNTGTSPDWATFFRRVVLTLRRWNLS